MAKIKIEHLENIDVEKIALVDLPAIRRKFLIEKQDKKISISIESDGTIKGSKIIVNGEEIKNLQDFHFSFYKPRGEIGETVGSPISCSYSKITETEDGFKHSDTFYLSKSEMEVNKMDKELKELLDSYFGEEVSFDTEEFEKAKLSDKALDAIKGALNLVNKYKADFPDDLKKAVGTLAKYASYGYGYPAKKSDDNKDINKAGKTLSKDTVTKVKSVIKAFNELQNVVKALNDLLPEEDQKNLKKSDATEGKDADEEFKNAIDEVTGIAKKLEKKLVEKDETIEKLNKRLETVEKEKGIKKSIEGQDDDDGDGDKSKKKWGSFNL